MHAMVRWLLRLWGQHWHERLAATLRADEAGLEWQAPLLDLGVFPAPRERQHVLKRERKCEVGPHNAGILIVKHATLDFAF